jgi:hypothetical protein
VSAGKPEVANVRTFPEAIQTFLQKKKTKEKKKKSTKTVMIWLSHPSCRDIVPETYFEEPESSFDCVKNTPEFFRSFGMSGHREFR